MVIPNVYGLEPSAIDDLGIAQHHPITNVKDESKLKPGFPFTDGLVSMMKSLWTQSNVQ